MTKYVISKIKKQKSYYSFFVVEILVNILLTILGKLYNNFFN